MNENDLPRILSEDPLLREALSRREQKRPQMPAHLNERVMKRLATKPASRRRWLIPAIAAVAASLLLLLTMHLLNVEQPLTAHQDEKPKQAKVCHVPVKHVTKDHEPAPQQKTLTQVSSPRTRKKGTAARNTQRATARPEKAIPDTLGNGIWHSKENVLLAIQLLSECEQTIERSEQRIRNDIVRATYHATPQPANAQLVINDNGDYMVVEDSQPAIIEL